MKTASNFGVRKMRISGAEPTLGREHLLGLLELVEESTIDVFILETNGILFGADETYVKEISKFKKPHIRVSLKAATSTGFQKRTGAKGEFSELPYQAIGYLLDSKVSFHVAAMTDRKVMDRKERKIMLQKLTEIDSDLATHLEEEKIDPYETTVKRMEKAGIELKWVNQGYVER
jgi:uncharacterized Fe-S cluster-containing radical SAM superfamily protein